MGGDMVIEIEIAGQLPEENLGSTIEDNMKAG